MTDTMTTVQSAAPVHEARRPNKTAITAAVVLGAVLTCGGAWRIEHRQIGPMDSSAARIAAIDWCAYNFPTSSSSQNVDPNDNSYACVLGFLGGANDPGADEHRAESQLSTLRVRVGADSPLGMWAIAFMAGWRAGQHAAESA